MGNNRINNDTFGHNNNTIKRKAMTLVSDKLKDGTPIYYWEENGKRIGINFSSRRKAEAWRKESGR